MTFTCSLAILFRTFGLRDHGGLMYGNVSTFQSMEKAFVRTSSGSYVLL